MIADVVARRTDHLGVGRAAAGAHRHVALVEPLHGERARHLGEELVVEPAHQPAHLDPRARLARQQPLVAELAAPGLVEILGDDGGARNRRMAFLHQHRRGAGRVEHQELLAALPHPLLDRARGKAVLAERQAHEARMRAERVMEQRQHAALRLRIAAICVTQVLQCTSSSGHRARALARRKRLDVGSSSTRGARYVCAGPLE